MLLLKPRVQNIACLIIFRVEVCKGSIAVCFGSEVDTLANKMGTFKPFELVYKPVISALNAEAE